MYICQEILQICEAVDHAHLCWLGLSFTAKNALALAESESASGVLLVGEDFLSVTQ